MPTKFTNLTREDAVNRALEILETGEADGVTKVEITMQTGGKFTITVFP